MLRGYVVLGLFACTLMASGGTGYLVRPTTTFSCLLDLVAELFSHLVGLVLEVLLLV